MHLVITLGDNGECMRYSVPAWERIDQAWALTEQARFKSVGKIMPRGSQILLSTW